MDESLVLARPLPRTMDLICDAEARRRVEGLGRLVISEQRAMLSEVVERGLPQTAPIDIFAPAD